MSGREENASSGDAERRGNFPASWGTPPGTAYSDERAAWVRRNTKLAQVQNIDRRAERAATDPVIKATNGHDAAPYNAAKALALAKALAALRL